MKTYEEMNQDEKIEYNTRTVKEGSFKIETPEEFGELQPFKLTCKSCQTLLLKGQNEFGDGSILLDHQTLVFKAYCNECIKSLTENNFDPDFTSLEIVMFQNEVTGYRIACASCERRLFRIYLQEEFFKLKVNIVNKMFKALCLECIESIWGNKK